MNSHKEWMAQISEVDEIFGKEPRYPITTMQLHINNLVNKQNKVIQETTNDLRDNMVSAINIVGGSIENGFKVLQESLGEGFEMLNNSINNQTDVNALGFTEVINQIENISSILNWGFSQIIELDRQRNVKLDEIIDVLHKPEIEKERKLYIETGLNYSKKASIDQLFFKEAKKYFEKALAIKSDDYFTVYNLGLIHFFSKDYNNFKKSIEYFKKSAIYAKADISFSPVKYSTNFSSFLTFVDPLTISTYSYLYAGRSEYLLGNFKEALELINESYNLSPNIVEIIYDRAILLAVNNRINESIDMLNKAIQIDRFITTKIQVEKDLIGHMEILVFLETIRSNTTNEAKRILAKGYDLIHKDSSFYNRLDEVKKIIEKNTFLDSKSALDLLN